MTRITPEGASPSAGSDEAAGTEAASPRATIYDAFRRPRDRRLRRLPGLVAGAFTLVWQAARVELLAIIALQVISGVGVAIQLLLGSRVLAAILTADRQDEGSPPSCPVWWSSSLSASS